MAEKSIDMTEHYFDMAIGFLPVAGTQLLIAGDPSLVKIEIVMRYESNYSGTP